MSQPTGFRTSLIDQRSVRLLRALVVLVTAVVVTFAGPLPQASAQRKPYVPANGPVFNNPVRASDRFVIQNKLVAAINNTPRGAVIRISVYSFDRREVARALIAARRRGVTVQVLMNDHQTMKAQRMLFAVLGKNPRAANFAYQCKHGCRSRPEFMHSKFYLFSQTGAARNVVFVGSANFTLNAVRHQWNDMYSIRDHPALFNQFVALFDDMRKDYSVDQPSFEFCDSAARAGCNFRTNTFFNWVFPRRTSREHDPVTNLLDEVGCTWTDARRKKRRTIVRLQMHTLRFDRGVYIARTINSLWRRGCDVKVIYGLSAKDVNRALGAPTSRGKMPLRSSGFDYDDDFDPERYTHQKTLTIEGRFAGQNHVYVSLTGSSNWSGRGNSGDEIMFLVRGADTVRKYRANWNLIWNHYSRNAYTTTINDWGQPREDDKSAPPAPDRLPVERPGGHWEND